MGLQLQVVIAEPSFTPKVKQKMTGGLGSCYPLSQMYMYTHIDVVACACVHACVYTYRCDCMCMGVCV